MSVKTIKLYTAQSNIVVKTIKENEVSYVKKEYIETKYGNEISKIILIAYDWFVKEMERKIGKPEKAEYPVWLFKNKKYALTYGADNLLNLNIPEKEVILFDNRKWERVLNLNYVGNSLDEEKEFDRKLRNYGMQTGYDVFKSPLHINLKKQIKDSFSRVFEMEDKSIVRGASWCLKKEWIELN
ncbi:MAG: DUF3841 domain-containing protein [Bacillota bacterium]|nr:DUF3841 domain-containing protein [Bacillota bacterium]